MTYRLGIKFFSKIEKPNIFLNWKLIWSKIHDKIILYFLPYVYLT